MRILMEIYEFDVVGWQEPWLMRRYKTGKGKVQGKLRNRDK